MYCNLLCMKMFTLCFSLLLTISSSAFAFHIPEHNMITRRAIDGLQRCNLLPASWDMGWSRAIQDGNKNEDTNLIRKWSKYSHFYNPTKKLKLGRADSMLTVRESEHSLHDQEEEASEADALALVGRIVHHLQDAAVPAHVVPVNHFSDDGFEKFEIASYYQAPTSLSDCARLRAEEPSALLKNTALTTLSRIEGLVGYKTYKRVKQARWSQLFWLSARGEGFGEYGPLGNNFGKNVFELEDGRTARVELSQYREFKQAQLDLAVLATQSAILWATSQILDH